MKKLTGNDLSELQSLTCSLQREIERYSHVSEHLPKSLTKALNEYRDRLAGERERREEQC